MIENKFPVTVEDLNETSSRILWYTPRYRKTMIVMPIVIIVMMVILRLIQPDASILLMVVLALVLLYYLYSSSRKVPHRMSAQLYQDMKKKSEEPEIHTLVNEGGVLVVGVDDDSDQTYPFSTIRRVFSTEHFIVAMNQANRAVLFRRDGFLQGSEAALLEAFRAHCPGAVFDKKLDA